MKRYSYFLHSIAASALISSVAVAEPRNLEGAVCATQVGIESAMAYFEAVGGEPQEGVDAVNKADSTAKCALRRVLAEKGTPVNTVTYDGQDFDIVPVAIIGDTVEGVIMVGRGERGFMVLPSPPKV